jgi:RHS repeat-associated protein
MTHDQSGKVKTRLDAEGGLTTYDYDANGNQTKVVNALGQTTLMIYDAKNQLLETILDDNTPNDLTDNPRLKNEYDLVGDKTAIVDQKGRKTNYSYDALKRPTGMVLPDGTPLDNSDNTQVGVTYNTLGWMTKLVKDGITTEFEYDKAGRITKTWVTQNGQRLESSTVYDKAGRAVAKRDALGVTTKYVYDELDRLTETIYTDGKSDQTVYNYAGKEIAKLDRAGLTTKYEYDALDRLTAVVDAKNSRTTYAYDEDGNLVRQTDANQHTTAYEYDGLKRRTAVIRPLGERSTTVYDKLGRVEQTTDFNGAVIKYGYDKENQLISKQLVNEGNRIETYNTAVDARSRTVTDARGTTSYTYDEQGRMLAQTEPDGKQISYTYDLVTGKVATVTTPSGTTQYRYNSLSQLAKVISAEGETTYAYNAIGNLQTKTLPNGIVETYGYDGLNRLNLVEQKNAAGTVLARYAYTFDAVGNKTKVEELGGRSVSYTYDELYRLTKEAITDAVQGNRTIEYVYDAVGNRLVKRDTAVGETAYRYNQNDWLLDETLGSVITAYTYDKNGNTKTKTTGTESTNYVWDTQNRLTAATISASGQNQQLGYEYDVEGIRTKSVVNGAETRYLVDENRQYAEVLEEYNNAGVQSRYVYGAELDLISQTRSGATSIYLEDGHSGVRNLTNAAGTITDKYAYDAYGNVIYSVGSTQNVYQYRSEQSDPNLGMQYLRARYYNPKNGRLTSVDSFGGWREQPMSQHRYIYGNNNPTTYADPTGKFSETLAIPAVLNSVIETLLTLYAFAAAQAALSYTLQKLTGQIDWIGQFVGIDTPVGGVRGTILKARAIQQSQIVNMGAERPFSGQWLQFSVGIDLGDLYGGVRVPSNPIINDTVYLRSPRWIGAQPGALSGAVAFGGPSTGDLKGQAVVIGLGVGVFANLSPEDIQGGIPSISSYAGLSIPWRGSEE